MANDFSAFIKKMDKASTAVANVRVDMVKKASLAITTATRAEIRTASGGDSRLSGVGKRGAAVGARFKLEAGGNPTATVFATGPLHFIERDTKAGPRAHRMSRKKLRASGLANREFAGPLQHQGNGHPGTKGKHPFEKGIEKGEKVVPKVMAQSVHSSLAKVFS